MARKMRNALFIVGFLVLLALVQEQKGLSSMLNDLDEAFNNLNFENFNQTTVSHTGQLKEIPSSCVTDGCVVVFIHIPKTGGTSIMQAYKAYNRMALKEKRSDLNIDYFMATNDDGRKLKAQVDKYVTGIPDKKPHIVEFHGMKNPTFWGMSQDGSLDRWRQTAKEHNVTFFAFSVFRSPVPWAVSAYNMGCIDLYGKACGPKRIRSKIDNVPSMISYMQKQPNPQCAFLRLGGQLLSYANLEYHDTRTEEDDREFCLNEIWPLMVEKLDWVGTLERLDETFDLLRTLMIQPEYHSWFDLRHSNDVSSKRPLKDGFQRLSTTMLNQSDIQVLKKASVQDGVLHERAQQHFTKAMWKWPEIEVFVEKKEDSAVTEPPQMGTDSPQQTESPQVESSSNPIEGDLDPAFGNSTLGDIVPKEIPSSCVTDGCVVVFFHIPKTGGTSISDTYKAYNKLASKNKRPDLKIPYLMTVNDDGTKLKGEVEKYITGIPDKKPHVVEFHGLKNPTFWEMSQKGILNQWRETAKEHNVTFFAFSVFRNPVPWAVSAYNMGCIDYYGSVCHKNGLKTRIDNVPSLTSYLQKHPNPQCAFLRLGGRLLTYTNIQRYHKKRTVEDDREFCLNELWPSMVETLDWVGTLERLDETFDVLRTIMIQPEYHSWFNLRHSNDAKDKKPLKDGYERLSAKMLNESDIQILQAAAVQDEVLHERASQRYTKAMWKWPQISNTSKIPK